MIKLTFFRVCFLICFFVESTGLLSTQAQEVSRYAIGGSGGSYTSGNYQITGIIGQLSITSYTSGNNRLQVKEGFYEDTADEYVPVLSTSTGVSSDIGISPNPMWNNMTIQIQESSELSQYCIMDMHGRTVMSGHISGLQTSVDVSALSPQIYLLYCYNESGLSTKTFKILKTN